MTADKRRNVALMVLVHVLVQDEAAGAEVREQRRRGNLRGRGQLSAIT